MQARLAAAGQIRHPAQQKKLLTLGSALLLAVCALFALHSTAYQRAGEVTSFCFQAGHAWTGYHCYTIERQNGKIVATHYTRGRTKAADPQPDTRASAEWTAEELENFSRELVQLGVPGWKRYYRPKVETTDGSNWSLSATFTRRGKLSSGGYYVFPAQYDEFSALLERYFPS